MSKTKFSLNVGVQENDKNSFQTNNIEKKRKRLKRLKEKSEDEKNNDI